jgi:hypothetical protein
MLRCKEITEKANEFVEHELPIFDRLKFRVHLFMCVNCKRYVDQIRTTIFTLRQMNPNKDTSSEVVNSVLKHIKQGVHPPNVEK